MSFVPTVVEISGEEAGGIPGLDGVVSYWTEGDHSAEDWFREVSLCWGTAGLVMRRGDGIEGFVVYGPPGYLPRAGRYPVGPLDEDAALLAYLSGSLRTRRYLLIRMLKDLRQRGFETVEAVAGDLDQPRHVSTRFLLESGWQPARHGWYMGLPHTLVRTDLSNTVEVSKLARGLIGRVKLPKLKRPAPTPAPGSLLRAVPEPERLREAGSRS